MPDVLDTSAPNTAWFIGSASAPRVLSLADRFHQLVLDDATGEFGINYPNYVPWMATPLRHRLSSLFVAANVRDQSRLISDPRVLSLLAGAFGDPVGHAFSQIVPYNIEAKIRIPSSTEAVVWDRLLQNAKILLFDAVPWITTVFEKLIYCVVPIEHRPSGVPKKRGFSTPLAYGAIFLTFEDRDPNKEIAAAELAVDLAHELGHHILYLYQAADPLIATDLEKPVYSGVRRTLRPAIMSMHAAAALSYMLEVTRALRSRSATSHAIRIFAQTKWTEYAHDQEDTVAALNASSSFTSIGRRLMRDFESQIHCVPDHSSQI